MEEYFLRLISGQKRGPWAAFQRAGLWLLSVPYGWAVRLHQANFRIGLSCAHKAPVPVISVGNLTLGGTGKTPCVEYVARFFREFDLRVAILSRGYGSTSGPNDEALVLEENLPDVPHYQGQARAHLALVAVRESESEVLVMDDGFQHRSLDRDLDLVLLDATNPWGHGYLFPRGLLRERPSSLRRAGVVLLTRCDQVPPEEVGRLRAQVGRMAPRVPVVETIHEPVELVNADRAVAPLERIRGRPVAAFCGIGNPEAFRQTLLRLGAEIVAVRTLPDHHKYTREGIEELRTWARQQARDCVIVTTQKDLVKIRLARLGERELWALRIRLRVTAGQEALDRKLKEALG